MTINLNNNAVINNALGEHDHHCSKPVICIETGEVFISATDAARHAGVTLDAMSQCCRGKLRTCKGKHYCYVSKTSENIDVLTAHIRAMNAKQEQLEADAALGRAIREEQEAKRKAEEEREQALAKANAKVERRQRVVDRLKNDLAAAMGRLITAHQELAELEGREMSA